MAGARSLSTSRSIPGRLGDPALFCQHLSRAALQPCPGSGAPGGRSCCRRLRCRGCSGLRPSSPSPPGTHRCPHTRSSPCTLSRPPVATAAQEHSGTAAAAGNLRHVSTSCSCRVRACPYDGASSRARARETVVHAQAALRAATCGGRALRCSRRRGEPWGEGEAGHAPARERGGAAAGARGPGRPLVPLLRL